VLGSVLVSACALHCASGESVSHVAKLGLTVRGERLKEAVSVFCLAFTMTGIACGLTPLTQARLVVPVESALVGTEPLRSKRMLPRLNPAPVRGA
jgi:hypothetical protein